MGAFLIWGVIYAIVILVILKVYIKLTTGWCRSSVCLTGKTAIITGANTGIGYETALDFAKRGARVILACRSEERARKARDQIIKDTHNDDVHIKLVDFASLASVKKFAKDINENEIRLDILVNNAGMEHGTGTTEDGLEFLMQVNYFGHVLLNHLLLDMLKKTSGRIVNVSSLAGKRGKLAAEDVNFEGLNVNVGRGKLYCRTKLCQILHTIELAPRLRGTGVTVYSLHPGAVKTEFFKSVPSWAKVLMKLLFLYLKNSVEGAQTQIYCAIEDGLERHTGEHFADCQMVKRYKSAQDPVVAKKLWDVTMKILKIE